MAVAILVAAMAVAAAVLLYVGRGQTIQGDAMSYAVRLANESFGHAVFHSPPNKYFIAVPLVIYDAMFEVFGLGADLPYRAVVTVLVLLCAGLFYTIARRRVGDLLALAPTVLLLFFGAGWETVITAARIPSLIAVASGLGALLAVERRDLKGDVTGAGLLTVAVASHPTGLAFLAASSVRIVFRPLPQRWRTLWVVAIPAAVFGAWWLFLRSPTTREYFPTRFIDVVNFARDSWTTITADVTGLAGVLDQPIFQQAAARVAAGALLGLVIVGVVTRWRRVPASFWAALAAAVVMLAAARLSPGGFLRSPDEVRYLYPVGVVFLLLLTELAGMVGLRGWAALAAAAVLGLGLVYNLDRLRDGGAEARTRSQVSVAEFTAYEMAAGPALQEGFRPRNFDVSAGEYLEAADAFGSAADSPAELATASPRARHAADAALVGSLGIAVRPASAGTGGETQPPQVNLELSGRAARQGGCVRLQPGGPANGTPAVTVPLIPSISAERKLKAAIRGEPIGPIPRVPELAELTMGDQGVLLSAPDMRQTAVLLGRIAQPPSVQLDRPPPGRAAVLRIPADGPGPPWRVTIASGGPVRVCGA